MCTRSHSSRLTMVRNSQKLLRERSGSARETVWKLAGRGPISFTLAGEPMRKYVVSWSSLPRVRTTLRMYVPTPNSVIRRMSMAIFTEGNLTQGGYPLLPNLPRNAEVQIQRNGYRRNDRKSLQPHEYYLAPVHGFLLQNLELFSALFARESVGSHRDERKITNYREHGCIVFSTGAPYLNIRSSVGPPTIAPGREG